MMKKNSKLRHAAARLLNSSVALSALALGSAASAQVAEPIRDPNSAATDVEAAAEPDTTETGSPGSVDARGQQDIVVTGTLIRGIAPPGASVVLVDQEDIQATGATSVNDVLESVPQIGSFGTLQQPLGLSQEVSTNKPNLRNLPGFNTAGGSTTLVLLDGHRLVGMGTASTVPDPDIIPPGVLERVEIVPDGGSAIYGSDAVAGVLNFITIRRFDGVKVDAQYGFADDFYRFSGNLTSGRDWGSGSLYASYNHARNDVLLGRDRDYIRQFPDARTGVTSLTCSPGNIFDLANRPLDQAFTGLTAAGTAATAIRGIPNECDASDFATVFPAQRRHSVFAGLTQDLNESITIDLRAFYTNRKTMIENGPYTFSEIITFTRNPAVPSTVTPLAFPFFRAGAGFAQQVSGRFGSDDARQTRIELDTWGITPTITADLGGNFQLRVLGSYGQSVSKFNSEQVNQIALRNAIRTGLFNPFNPTTATPEVIAAITNYEAFGRTTQYFQDLRAILDGDLFELPGGAVKAAVGLEYFKEEFEPQRGETVPGFENSGFGGLSIGNNLIIPAGNPIRRSQLDRQVKSAFGELVIPLFGAANRTGGLYSLTFSAAARYDDYDDVGSTFNPRFGLTYRPVDWVSVFGAWGQSFNAPSLADRPQSDVTTTFILAGSSASFFAPPAALQRRNGGPLPDYTGGAIVATRGNAPDIEPQEATTWNVGFDVRPPFVDGLRFGATYYNIEFNNQIGLPPFESPATLYNEFLNIITFAPSQAVIDNAIATADIVNGQTPVSANTVYAFFDARRRNLGEFKLDGIDFRLAYDRAFDFGSMFLNVNGTYELNRERSNVAGGAFRDVLSDNANRLRVRSTLGARSGDLLGQVTWNHLQGFDLDPAIGFAGTTFGGETFVAQDQVDDFNSFDLFFRYEVGGTGLAQDLAFTLNVENVFDHNPPVFRGADQVAGRSGTANGNTLGRLVQFGVSKKF